MLSCRSLRLSGNIYCEDIIDGLPAKGKFLILAIGTNRARNTERAKVADLEAITNLMYLNAALGDGCLEFQSRTEVPIKLSSPMMLTRWLSSIQVASSNALQCI